MSDASSYNNCTQFYGLLYVIPNWILTIGGMTFVDLIRACAVCILPLPLFKILLFYSS